MSWSRWQKFLRTIPARITGSHVELKRHEPTYLSSWAQFPPDQRLALRLQAARDLIGEREVVADRILVEPQPDFGERHNWSYDANGSPVDFENELPIG